MKCTTSACRCGRAHHSPPPCPSSKPGTWCPHRRQGRSRHRAAAPASSGGRWAGNRGEGVVDPLHAAQVVTGDQVRGCGGPRDEDDDDRGDDEDHLSGAPPPRRGAGLAWIPHELARGRRSRAIGSQRARALITGWRHPRSRIVDWKHLPATRGSSITVLPGALFRTTGGLCRPARQIIGLFQDPCWGTAGQLNFLLS